MYLSGPKVDMAVLKQQNQEILRQARNQRLALAEKIRSGMACMQNIPELQSKAETLLRQVQRGNEMTNLSEISAEYQILWENFQEQNGKNLETLKSDALEKIRHETSAMQGIQQKHFVFTAPEPAEATPEFSPEQEIQDFLHSQEMTVSHRKAVQDILSDMHSAPQRKELYYQEYLKISALIRIQMHSMKLLYQQYQNECFDMPENEIKKFSDFQTPEEITQETEHIRQKAGTALEKDYIRRQIDDVMTKYGYDVLQSELLSPADGQTLYQVNSDTAVNVFVSDQNQVTMRVVGIGFDTNITPEEDETLFQEQCAFCRMHPQIVEELALRGILLQEKKHLPADKKYNKKIQTESRSETSGRSSRKRSAPEQQKNIMYRS